MKYWAFISYSHQDRRAAERLHRALESYRLPLKQIAKQTSSGEDVPRRLAPIFIDRAELASSSSLGGTLNTALHESRSLIVLCSPAARASSYVEEEILEFQKIGRQLQILAVVVDWGPRGAAEDVFPRPLGGDGEPLAADLKKDGSNNAKLKLIAGILGIGFDQLKQRDRIRRRWRRMAMALQALLVLLCLAGAIDAGAPFPLGNSIRRLIDQYDLSIFRHAPSQASLNATVSSLRKKILPMSVADMEGGDVLTYNSDGHVGGTWDLGQIAAAITAAPEANEGDLRSRPADA